MAQRRRTAAALAALAFVSVGSASCSGDADPERAFGNRYLESMLGFTSPDEDEQVMMDYTQIEEGVIESCMTDAGFEYVAAPPESVVISLGYTDDEQHNAELLGFGISTIDPSAYEAATNPNDEIVMRLGSSAEGQAWNEKYIECAEYAHQQTVDQHGIDDAGEISTEVEAGVRADRRVTDAEREWSGCMTERGFPAPNRQALIDRLTDDFATIDPAGVAAFRQREIDAALADVECGEELRTIENTVRRELLEQISPSDYDAIFG